MQKLDDFVELIRRLRAPEGCPWTREQTHETLAPHIIEESYETVAAIKDGDLNDGLKDELGDMLLEIVLQTTIAEERDAFTFEDIVDAISDKLYRRYPTILGDDPEELTTPEEIHERWEQVKAAERAEKGYESVLDGISPSLPALIRAVKIKGRIAREGFEWSGLETAWGKIEEELGELREEIDNNSPREKMMDELGDVLYTVADLGRWLKVDAEEALQATNNKFEGRVRGMEAGAAARGKAIGDCDINEQFELYKAAKSLEKQKKAS